MDFETLSRRELQALCKKNKIPANITNVAMIDALKALSFVEGLQELMQQSPGQRTAAAKQEPETVQPLTRTRRTTRKTVAKDAVEGAMETPSVVQTTTRRARVTSVCRKMDAQLKECEEEEDNKKGAVETPAPSGVATRRRRGVKEESVVKREYSTRRSTRLAEKVEEVLDDVENEKSDLIKTKLFAKDGENVTASVEESLDTVEEASEVTGTEADSILEENPEEVDESEVVSVRNHQVQVSAESSLAAIVENLERKDESESVPVQEQHIQNVEETENATAFEEENPEEMGESEVVSVQNHQVEVGEESNLEAIVENLERKDESESIPVQEQHIQTVEETEKATTFEEERSQMSEVDDQKLDAVQVPLKAMDVDVNSSVEENLEGNDESGVDSVKEMCEDQDMAFDVNGEQGTDEVNQVTDNSNIDTAMTEAVESVMQENFEGSDLHLNFKPTCLTPFKEVYVRKATQTKNSTTIISDNKENVGSEVKAVLNKETVKMAPKDTAKELNDLSVRQLTKMLREKLTINSKKMPQNENVNEAYGRPALKTLSENQMVNEARN